MNCCYIMILEHPKPLIKNIYGCTVYIYNCLLDEIIECRKIVLKWKLMSPTIN